MDLRQEMTLHAIRPPVFLYFQLTPENVLITITEG